MRKSTGLHNRYRRRGAGRYARARKSLTADRYGQWKDGRLIQPESIARHYDDRQQESA